MALHSNGTGGLSEIRRSLWRRLRTPIWQDGIVLAPLVAFLALERFRPAWWSSDIGALVLIAALAVIRTAARIMRRPGAANLRAANLRAVNQAARLLAVLMLLASFVGSIFACLLVCASLTLVANLLLGDRQPYGIGREGGMGRDDQRAGRDRRTAAPRRARLDRPSA